MQRALLAFLSIFVATTASAFDMDPTERAMAGLMTARMIDQSCSPETAWAGQSGPTTFYAKNFKVLQSEGHSKQRLRKFERHKTKWIQASLFWMQDAGVDMASLLNEDGRSEVCAWAAKVAGTSHPVGRFLAN